MEKFIHSPHTRKLGKIWQVSANYVQVADEILLLLPMLKSINYNNGNMVTNFSK